MTKIVYRIIITISIFLIISITYLSIIGISTNIFNSNIIKQVKKIDENLIIDLKKVFIILDPFKFKLKLKTLGANLTYNEKKIEFENIKSDISLKSIVNNEFSLNKIIISTKPIEIKSLIKLLRLVQKDPKLYIAEKVVKKGYVIADLDLEFDENGIINENYQIKGIVKNGTINFLRKYNLESINFNFNLKKDKIKFDDFTIKVENEIFKIPQIVSIKKKNRYFVSGKLINDEIKLIDHKILRFFKFDNLNLKVKEINFKSESNFNFYIDKKFKVLDLKVDSKVNLVNMEIENNLDLINFFPKIKKKIILKNNLLQIIYQKGIYDIAGSGNLYLQKNVDKISYKILKDKKKIKFNTKLEIKDNDFVLNILNFKKKNKSDLKIQIDGFQKENEGILFKRVNLVENKNSISMSNLFFSNKGKIKDVKNINLNYEDKDNLKNFVKIYKKNKDYFIEGTSLNINHLIRDLLANKNIKNNSLNRKNLKFSIKIDEVYLDKDNKLTDFAGYILYKNSKVFETVLSSKFRNNKEIKFTVKTKGNETITTLFSDNAKPIVTRYKFIKGFDEGSLDFFSIKKDNKSTSTIKIYDFKLKELPALTKLLTLASLQGIADLLSGEGIRFNEFEMNFSNEGKLMKINEIYAIGPAISVLMSGYIEADNLVSLRGTLVPATTLNKTIGSIPFLGDILVGKKAGEGVFGVSFKIKGPPKKLETTVNPIKTLTPRFITRTLEKIKN